MCDYVSRQRLVDNALCKEIAVTADLVWIDLEMTGLDPDNEVIIEIATIVTDSSLNLVAEGPSMAVQAPQDKLDGMDEWNQTHHKASGLLDRVLKSPISVVEAEAQTLAFLEQHVTRNSSPLCGNSVWQDRRFLSRYMPTLENYLHYRLIDVSSLKELVRRWRPDLLAGFKKKNAHTALADIRESIDELRFYRDNFLKLE
jgi:oligoribonuclease